MAIRTSTEYIKNIRSSQQVNRLDNRSVGNLINRRISSPDYHFYSSVGFLEFLFCQNFFFPYSKYVVRNFHSCALLDVQLHSSWLSDYELQQESVSVSSTPLNGGFCRSDRRKRFYLNPSICDSVKITQRIKKFCFMRRLLSNNSHSTECNNDLFPHCCTHRMQSLSVIVREKPEADVWL